MGEAVVVTREIGVPAPLELARQPLAAIEADLHVEGEPGLQPGAHEPEDRVEEVLVDVQALARTQAQPALARVGRAMVLEAHAGLDGPEGTDQPLLDRMLREQFARQVLLVDRSGLQVANGPLLPRRRRAATPP